MRLYEGTIKEFNGHVLNNRIADLVADRYKDYYLRKVNESEYRAWQQSLTVLNNSFLVSGLTDNKLVVEYELPYSARRIDVLLFGTGEDKKENVVLIELKQWSNDHVDDCVTEGNVIVDYGRRKSEQAHPSLQVQGYHYDLEDFLLVFQERQFVNLGSCAYCHNYSRKGKNVLFAPKFRKIIETFPLFGKEDVKELGMYLKERLHKGPGLEIFSRFINSPIRASKKLMEHTGEMINKQQVFNLIDDQIAAFNAILHKAKHLAKTKKKSLIIVKGGPGTGKSVIALEVMGELMRQGKQVFHATGSSAFTKTLRKVIGRRTESLFKYFFSFTQHKEDEIDVLICDEAHRIRAHSKDYGVPFKFISSRPQIEDLIRPARLSIFFIDENQVVRPKEIGSVGLIKEAAVKLGVEVSEISEFELKTQFRCSGSDAYLQWLDKTLGVRDTEIMAFDHKMEVVIFDDPVKMKNAIGKRNQEKRNSARIATGFCWPWSKPRVDGSLVNDVKIGNFEMPWEKKDEFWKWATDDSGMEQVGTVYTAQGFEFDYIGVIFGNDLFYDEKKKDWIAKPENSHDSMVKRNNVDLVRHLKNVYRVLLSRAHKGVYLYFMDKETEAYFKTQMEIGKSAKLATLKAVSLDNSKDDFLEDLLSDEEVQETKRFVDYLPVHSLKAAASGFRQEDVVEKLGWKKMNAKIKLSKDMFIARVIGKSMEPTIRDGSYCVFKSYKGGSRNELVVLVESGLVSDPENNQRYTVKRYHSEKEFFDDGTWVHKKIVLSPDNKAFDNIELENVDPENFRVVAEFVVVL